MRQPRVKRSENFVLVLSMMLLSTLLFSCSVKKPTENNGYGQRVIRFQPVPEALSNRVWLEQFDLSFNKSHLATVLAQLSNEAMLIQTELTPQGINLAAMTFAGVPLAQVSWQSDSQKVYTEMAAARHFDGQQVIHDLQLINWPKDIIKAALLPGFSFNESFHEGIRTRRFYQGEQVIIIVRYQEQTVSFEQKAIGYRLQINRLSDTELTAQ